jgi:hypothetical protein
VASERGALHSRHARQTANQFGYRFDLRVAAINIRGSCGRGAATPSHGGGTGKV